MDHTPRPSTADAPSPGWEQTMSDLDTDPAVVVTEVDLDTDPRTEVEALCLCSLLWSTRPDAVVVVDALAAGDFADPVHRELFAVIGTQVRAGDPQDPASINAALLAAGTTRRHHSTQVHRTLAVVTTADAAPTAARHYAGLVLAAAYRRGFHTAAQALTQAATEAAQDALFDHLLSIGRAQRAATIRLHTTLHALRAAPGRCRSPKEGSPP